MPFDANLAEKAWPMQFKVAFQPFNSLCYLYSGCKWLYSHGSSRSACEIVGAIVRKLLTLFSKSLHNALNRDFRPLTKERSKYQITADYLNLIGLVTWVFIGLNILKIYLELYA